MAGIIVEEFATKFIDTLLRISLEVNSEDIAKGGPITIDLGQGIAVTLNTANDNINLRVEAGLKFPFAIDASIPFLTVDIGLDDPFLKGVDRNIDVIAILERFGLKIGNVNVRTGINNIFPLAAGHEVDIATASVLDTKIAPAAQNLDVKAKIAFPSSKQIQDKVAAFASKLLKDGYGSTSESIAASGIVFGVSKEDSITALSKARVLLPSKSLITEKNVEVLLGLIGLKAGDLTLDGLLKRLDVRGVNLDASMEGKVRVDAAVGLKGLNLAATADLGFAGLTATLDSTRLADAAIPSGISVRTIDGSVVLNLGVDLFLGSGDTLQTAIAKLIETFADSKPTTFTSIGGASKVVFGVSATDYIDTLSGAALELNLDPFLQPAKKMVFEIIDGVIAGTSAYKLALNNVDVFWSSTKAIGSALSAAIGGLPGNITAKVPFLGLKAKVNGQDFILPVVNDFTFQNGVATAKADIGFIENDPLAQQLWILVGNVVFHRAGPTNLFVTGYGVMFGSSASKAYDLASKASINIYLDSFVKTVFDYFDKQRPVELKDIQAQILNEGIRTNIICSQLPDWLPVNVKLGTVVGQVTWRINGVQEPAFRIVDAIFTNIQVTPGKPITFDLLMSPDPSKETGFLKPLEEAIPFLVQFKDYAQFAYLGRVDVYEKGIEKGNSFNIFGRSEFEAPDLYLWQPITIKPLISNPFTRKGLQFKIEVFWPNPGPLHLDVGVLSVRLESEGDPLLTIESPGPVIVKNVNEGANENQGRQGLVNGVLAITIRWSNFNPLTFFENLFDLLNPAENFKLIIETIRPSEGPIKWLNIGLEQLPRDIIENLLPTVIALLGNVKLEIFGFSLSASLIPGFNKFLRAAKAKIEQYPAQHWNFVEEL
ncbi:hypothetical protein BC829DRAFT_390044 [Chytridium lagenaria]|nr:hypothetical protein BC829DRAFT_390044 [Chytridium lagenaria]